MNGKRVVIIGGTSGLGFAAAEKVVSQGASVVVASRGKDSVEKAVAALGDSAEGQILDVTDEKAVRDFFGRVGERHDVAEAYAYLMTNKHTTGTLLTVDGGAVLS